MQGLFKRFRWPAIGSVALVGLLVVGAVLDAAHLLPAEFGRMVSLDIGSAGGCSWSGTWVNSGGTPYVAGLIQSGAVVEGNSGEGSGLVGTLAGATLTGQIYRSGTPDRPFSVTLAADCNSFSGTSGEGAAAQPWEATRLAGNPCNWAGQWRTTEGGMSMREVAGMAVFFTVLGNEKASDTERPLYLAGMWDNAAPFPRFEITMAADCKSFAGTIQVQTSNGFVNKPWTGTRVVATPAAIAATATATPTCSFAGAWNSTYNLLTLTLSNGSLTGRYMNGVGTVTGTQAGNVLSGQWSSSAGTGRLQFTISSDCNSFTGTWGYNGAALPYTWSGTRSTSPTPAPAAPTATAPAPAATATAPAATPTAAPCTWAGAWYTTETSIAGVTSIVLTGNTVLGATGQNLGFTGTVAGATLNGQWTATTGSPTPFTATLSADCNSFTSTLSIGGTTWSGSRRVGYPCGWAGSWQTTAGPLSVQQARNQPIVFNFFGGALATSDTDRPQYASGIWPYGAGFPRFEFTMAADCKSFTGAAHVQGGDLVINGTRTGAGGVAGATATPAACSFAGQWNSTYAVLTVNGSGGSFTGTYANGTGTITATQTGNVLSGQWTSSAGTGRFRFTASSDCKSFTGTWGFGANETGTAWSGTRIS